MPADVVGLYCAVGLRFGLLVSTCTAGARETQVMFNQWAESHAHMVGCSEPWFRRGPAA